MVPVWRKWAIKIRPTTYTISRVSKYQQTVMMSPLFHFFKSMPRRSKIKIIIETFNFIEETNLELWWIYFTHSMPKMFQMFMSLKVGTLTCGNQYHIYWNNVWKQICCCSYNSYMQILLLYDRMTCEVLISWILLLVSIQPSWSVGCMP